MSTKARAAAALNESKARDERIKARAVAALNAPHASSHCGPVATNARNTLAAWLDGSITLRGDLANRHCAYLELIARHRTFFVPALAPVERNAWRVAGARSRTKVENTVVRGVPVSLKFLKQKRFDYADGFELYSFVAVRSNNILIGYVEAVECSGRKWFDPCDVRRKPFVVEFLIQRKQSFDEAVAYVIGANKPHR